MDHVLFEKRAVVEPVIYQLKNLCQLKRTRPRSPVNFLGNLFSGFIADAFSPKKPSLSVEFVREEAMSGFFLEDNRDIRFPGLRAEPWPFCRTTRILRIRRAEFHGF